MTMVRTRGGSLSRRRALVTVVAVLADALGERLLGVAVLADEAIEGLGDLDGVEVGALDVLDQRQLEGLLGRDVLDDDEHLLEAGALRGAPAALAGDELELGRAPPAPRRRTTSGSMSPCSRIDSRQLVELLLVEVLPRLPRLRDDLLDGADERRSLGGRSRREEPRGGARRARGRGRAAAGSSARSPVPGLGACSCRRRARALRRAFGRLPRRSTSRISRARLR